MIILLKENANARQVDNLKKFLTNRGFDLHISEGTQHTLIGLIGDTSKLDIDLISPWTWWSPCGAFRSRTKTPIASSTRRIPWWTWAARRSAAGIS